jgi:hypothetical protein
MPEYYSISLEDFVNSDEDTLLIPPPPSPVNISQNGVDRGDGMDGMDGVDGVGEIGEASEMDEADWFDELYHKLYEKKLKTNHPPSGITPFYDAQMSSQKYYTIPTQESEAKRIWLSANIPTHATRGMIEMKLSQWVIDSAELIHTWDKTIVKWKTQSGYSCSSEWNTLVRWLICATS